MALALAMTIARSIARAHQGDIILSNRPEGGLSAILRLPVMIAEIGKSQVVRTAGSSAQQSNLSHREQTP